MITHWLLLWVGWSQEKTPVSASDRPTGLHVIFTCMLLFLTSPFHEKVKAAHQTLLPARKQLTGSDILLIRLLCNRAIHIYLQERVECISKLPFRACPEALFRYLTHYASCQRSSTNPQFQVPAPPSAAWPFCIWFSHPFPAEREGLTQVTWALSIPNNTHCYPLHSAANIYSRSQKAEKWIACFFFHPFSSHSDPKFNPLGL